MSMDYVPKKRRRTSKRGSKKVTYKIVQPGSDALKYYLGEFPLGKTSNSIASEWSEANVEIVTKEEDDICIFHYDKQQSLIKMVTDAPLVSNIFSLNVFCIKLRQELDDIHLQLYFKTLPLQKYYPKVKNVIKEVFYMFFSIAENESRYRKSPMKSIPQSVDGISEIYENIRRIYNENKSDKMLDITVNTDNLKPQLRPYQQDAVRWMLQNEHDKANTWTEPHPEYTPITLQSGEIIYYNKFSGEVEVTIPEITYAQSGGILADEMGLGKTVEILACILSTPNNDSHDKEFTIVEQKRRHNWPTPPPLNEIEIDIEESKERKLFKKQPGSVKIYLQHMYNSVLKSVNEYREVPKVMMHCICGSEYDETTVCECVDCGKRQHAICMGFDVDRFGSDTYRCPQCWAKQPLLEAKGTLIVCPTSLRSQWCKEIRKHVRNGLRVLNYKGSNNLTLVYPVELLDYDLVITTFSVLQYELRFLNATERPLRNHSRYGHAGSPITFVRWHRLCFDEAQIVELNGDGSHMVVDMARELQAQYRWAITGTPISINVSDMYGLINYLQIEPFNEKHIFDNILYKPFTNGDKQPMLEFLAKCMWRTQKKDVLDQIDIPSQTFHEYKIIFSPVERYFYEREHELSRDDFIQKLKNYDPKTPLSSLKTADFRNVLAPLLSLRQACAHHKAVKGRYLISKKPVNSMKELLDALISRNMMECEENLRKIVSALNGLAGIYLLLQNPSQAAEEYRKVLQLRKDFQNDEVTGIKLGIDPLLLIHTTYNLADVLDNYEHVGRSIADAELHEDCRKLELKYLRKFSDRTIKAIQETATLTDEINQCEESLSLQPAEWYSYILENVYKNRHHDELNTRVKSLLDRFYSRVNDVFTQSETKYVKLLNDWEHSVEQLREECMNAVNDLYILEGDDIAIDVSLIQIASECHLRVTKNKPDKVKCVVCQTSDLLKKYECVLFESATDKANESWKPSHEENVMKTILQFGKNKRYDQTYLKEGEIYLNIYDVMKKEFKELRKTWTLIDGQICAFDEIDICKIRLQLKNEEEETKKQHIKEKNQVLKNLSYIIENQYEEINQLHEHELEFQRVNIENEGKISYKTLEKDIGTHKYLNTLYKQQVSGQQPDPCPICKNALDTKWNILKCGHCYCIDCMQMLLGQKISKFVICSVCREKQKIDDINIVVIKTETNDDDIKIKGNCSTKVEAIIKLIMRLKEDDPSVKILVFSNWMVVLSVLKSVFEQNDITSVILATQGFEKNLNLFKSEEKHITALLMPVKLGSKGLNLIEAQHIIFVEPILDPADELQAIGRVHRIGQTKTTYVHKFLIESSIEEKIHRATSKSAKEWDKNTVTLQQIKDLFCDESVIS